MDYIIIVVAAYLLGSFNFAILISKWFLKTDIREHGSRNAGTTNAFRVMGGKLAILVLVGDMLKGVIAVIIGGYFLGDLGKLIAGIFVIVGHIYPLYFKFKGGKGVATGAAMVLIFDVRIFAILALIFFAVIFITRYVSLASILASIGFPICMYVFYQDTIFVLIGAFLCFGIIYMHRANIKRLLKGQESKLSFSKK